MQKTLIENGPERGTVVSCECVGRAQEGNHTRPIESTPCVLHPTLFLLLTHQQQLSVLQDWEIGMGRRMILLAGCQDARIHTKPRPVSAISASNHR